MNEHTFNSRWYHVKISYHVKSFHSHHKSLNKLWQFKTNKKLKERNEEKFAYDSPYKLYQRQSAITNQKKSEIKISHVSQKLCQTELSPDQQVENLFWWQLQRHVRTVSIYPSSQKCSHPQSDIQTDGWTDKNPQSDIHAYQNTSKQQNFYLQFNSESVKSIMLMLSLIITQQRLMVLKTHTCDVDQMNEMNI